MTDLRWFVGKDYVAEHPGPGQVSRDDILTKFGEVTFEVPDQCLMLKHPCEGRFVVFIDNSRITEVTRY